MLVGPSLAPSAPLAGPLGRQRQNIVADKACMSTPIVWVFVMLPGADGGYCLRCSICELRGSQPFELSPARLRTARVS